jgi:hypothetical protein
MTRDRILGWTGHFLNDEPKRAPLCAAIAVPVAPAAAPVALVIPKPGELWPAQGGTYAGLRRGRDGTLYHLIVATGPDGETKCEWGPYGIDVPGTLLAAPPNFARQHREEAEHSRRRALDDVDGFTAFLQAACTDCFDITSDWVGRQPSRIGNAPTEQLVHLLLNSEDPAAAELRLRYLEDQGHAAARPELREWQSIGLCECGGLFAVGSVITAPGPDGFSQPVRAEVIFVGKRDDKPGVWYLLRDVRHSEPGALLSEDCLRSAS